LALLKRQRFALIVVSNQPDFACGLRSRRDLDHINGIIAVALPLEHLYVYYYDDGDGSACRKPKPAPFLEAAEQCGIDFASSFAIGARWRGGRVAANAGA